MGSTKTVFITGGNRRVGRAIVERFAGAGYVVLFTYNEGQAAAEELAASLNAKRPKSAHAYGVDLSKADPFNRLHNIVRLAANDRLDVLVNNASIFLPDDGPFGASFELQERMMRVNAIAPAVLTAALAPALVASHGCVINLVDLLAERPWPAYSAYCASKAALRASTLAFARKLAPHVRVNGIAPAVIDWPPDMPTADRAAYLKRVPLGRAGTPSDAAELAFQLAETMPYVTGQVIRLDGGRGLT